jgi:hypothetical protein
METGFEMTGDWRTKKWPGLATKVLLVCPAAMTSLFGTDTDAPARGCQPLFWIGWIVPLLSCRQLLRSALVSLSLFRSEASFHPSHPPYSLYGYTT